MEEVVYYEGSPAYGYLQAVGLLDQADQDDCIVAQPSTLSAELPSQSNEWSNEESQDPLSKQALHYSLSLSFVYWGYRMFITHRLLFIAPLTLIFCLMALVLDSEDLLTLLVAAIASLRVSRDRPQCVVQITQIFDRYRQWVAETGADGQVQMASVGHNIQVISRCLLEAGVDVVSWRDLYGVLGRLNQAVLRRYAGCCVGSRHWVQIGSKVWKMSVLSAQCQQMYSCLNQYFLHLQRCDYPTLPPIQFTNKYYEALYEQLQSAYTRLQQSNFSDTTKPSTEQLRQQMRAVLNLVKLEVIYQARSQQSSSHQPSRPAEVEEAWQQEQSSDQETIARRNRTQGGNLQMYFDGYEQNERVVTDESIREDVKNLKQRLESYLRTRLQAQQGSPAISCKDKQYNKEQTLFQKRKQGFGVLSDLPVRISSKMQHCYLQ